MPQESTMLEGERASRGRPPARAAVGQRRGRRLALLAAALAVLAAAGGAAFVWMGVYDVAANAQHTQPVYRLLEFTMHRAVKRRSADIEVPPLGDAAQLARGALCYRDHCVQCHGGPGVAPAPIGRSMQPLPGPLVDATQHWRPAELYWIVRNGIKMSGMPAWQYRLDDADQWALVAFMQRLPGLDRAGFAREAGPQAEGRCDGDPSMADTAAGARSTPEPSPATPTTDPVTTAMATAAPGDARRGRAALGQFACNACHRIPGVTGSDVHVGPPLAGMARRRLIAGAVPNTPEQMVRWIRTPQAIDPRTTMPDLGVGERDARDIAAYLATLH